MVTPRTVKSFEDDEEGSDQGFHQESESPAPYPNYEGDDEEVQKQSSLTVDARLRERRRRRLCYVVAAIVVLAVIVGLAVGLGLSVHKERTESQAGNVGNGGSGGGGGDGFGIVNTNNDGSRPQDVAAAPGTPTPAPSSSTAVPTSTPTELLISDESLAIMLRNTCHIANNAEYLSRNFQICRTDEVSLADLVTPEDEEKEELPTDELGNTISSGIFENVDTQDARITSKWMQVGDPIHGESEGDLSGTSISMSCDGYVLAVGALMNDGSDPGTTRKTGHVRVYHLDDTMKGLEWVQLGDDIDGDGDFDRFGGSLSLSSTGTRLAVGSNHNDDKGQLAGKVTIFDWIQDSGRAEFGRWTKLGDDIYGQEEGGYFGRAVSLSGNGMRLAVASTGADANDLSDERGEDVGKVNVYQLADDNSAWRPLGQELFGEGSQDYFGRAVALSGDGTTLAMGAFRSDHEGKIDVGVVRVYKYYDTSRKWVQLGQDIRGRGEEGDWFGLSVALSFHGERVIIGAPGDDNRNMPLPGYASVYELEPEGWKKIGDDLDGGYSVSLSFDGTRAAVGSYKGFENGVNAGQVLVYDLSEDSNMWIQAGKGINGEAQSMFGTSVAMSSNGHRIASGAPNSVGDTGVVETGSTSIYELCT